jgi:5-methyltetrahydropteroyltriglutamate--homocysteine methyltransferase
MTDKLLPTTLVGSYVQPEWLVDRSNLKGRLPPRVRAREMWRIDTEFLEDAQNDATLLAIRDMERAGIDILTDGEVRRESYSNRVATALGGIDIDNPGTAIDRTGHPNPVPRIAGKITRERPIEVDDVKFMRANTDRQIKITLPGPFTMTQQAQNDHYDSDEAAAMDYAAAVNEEVRDLFAAGADVVQLDEPYMQARPDIAKQYAIKAINRALDGIEGETAVHLCFGYAHVVHERPEGYSFLPELEDSLAKQISIETAQSGINLDVLNALPSKKIILGVLDLSTDEVETPEIVADRIRRALDHIPADRILVAPDCGMKYMRRDVAFGKLKAMCDGAAIVRAEL